MISVSAKYDHFTYRNTSRRKLLTYLHEKQGQYHHRKKSRKKYLCLGHELVYSGISDEPVCKDKQSANFSSESQSKQFCGKNILSSRKWYITAIISPEYSFFFNSGKIQRAFKASICFSKRKEEIRLKF